MGKMFAGLIAVICWFALVLQFALLAANPDIPFIELLARYFGYFTIVANVIVALTVTFGVFFPKTNLGQIYSSTTMMSAAATFISIVGVVYSLFLRSVWSPQGWQAIADHLLHDAVPLTYIAYWFVFVPKAGLTWRDPFKWLLFPVAYMSYALIHGAILNWYPYWFVDVNQLGYTKALTNAAFVLLAFLVVGFLYFGIAKAMSGTASADAN